MSKRGIEMASIHVAEAVSPFILERDGVALVFGIEWLPLLGAHMERQAAGLARQRKAAYRVVSAGEAASVGLLYGKRFRGARLCSAAAVFAARHRSGTTAAVLALPNGRHWLVAVHEAAVITLGDQCLDSIERIHHALAQLRDAHPGLVLQHVASSEDMLDELFGSAMHVGQLMGMSLRAAALRPAVLGTVTLILAGSVVGHRYMLDRASPSEAAPDPTQVWQLLMDEVAEKHPVHGVVGAYALYDALLGVPVALSGWSLAHAECVPEGGQWQCRVRYRRTPEAVNQDLIQAAPADWAVTFDPMEGAEAVWSVPMPTQALASVGLRATSQNDVRLLSVLQTLLPAFSELRVEASKPLAFRAPLDSRRQAIPRPRHMPLYHTRGIRLQAPLRSLSLLLPEMAHMSWQRVVLNVASIDQPSLRSSGLRISLTGSLYEIDDTGVRAAERPQLDVGGEHARVSDQQPGAFVRDPGLIAAQPDAVAGQPGFSADQPGAITSDRGSELRGPAENVTPESWANAVDGARTHAS